MRRVLLASLAVVACRESAPLDPDLRASATALRSGRPSPRPPPAAPFCMPPELTRVDRAELSSSGRALDFCVGSGDEPRVCASLDLDTGRYLPRVTLPVRDPQAPRSPGGRASRDGAWTIRTTNTEARVCGAAPGEPCRTVAIDGFTPSGKATRFGGENLPADVSADGKMLFVVRHEGDSAEKIVGETYDLDAGHRIGRFQLSMRAPTADPVLDYVTRVEWLGPSVLVHDCVGTSERSTECGGTLVEPRTGALRTVSIDMRHHDGQMYSLDLCAWSSTTFHVHEDTWALYDCAGSYAIRTDTRALWKDGKSRGQAMAKPDILGGSGARAGGGAGYVRRPGTNDLFIVHDGLAPGSVEQRDLATGESVQSFSAPACRRR